MLRLTHGEDISSGIDEAPCYLGCHHPRLRHREHIGTGTVFAPTLEALDTGEELLGALDRLDGGDDERLLEELIPQPRGRADGAQRGVQDGDAVTELFGLIE